MLNKNPASSTEVISDINKFKQKINKTLKEIFEKLNDAKNKYCL